MKGVLENGSHALIANARYLDEQRIPYDRSAFDQLAGRGLTVSYLVIDGEVRGVVAQGDQIKPTAREAVRQLKARGIAPVMLTSDPEDIVRLLDLGTNTTRKIKQNLWWGAGYNIVAIPLAAGVLAPVGILLSPAVGAVLMSLSTVIVAVNAMTLKNK